MTRYKVFTGLRNVLIMFFIILLIVTVVVGMSPTPVQSSVIRACIFTLVGAAVLAVLSHEIAEKS